MPRKKKSEDTPKPRKPRAKKVKAAQPESQDAIVKVARFTMRDGKQKRLEKRLLEMRENGIGNL